MEKDLVKFVSARACAAAAAEKANNRATAAATATATAASGRPERSAPKGSRLNRLLGNLERSILAQFGSSNSSSSASASTGSGGARSKKEIANGSKSTRRAAPPANSATSKQKEEPERNRGIGLQQSRSGAPKSTQFTQAAAAVVEPDSTKMTKSKTTLNKCQQQIVSTLRLPNRHQQQPAAFAGAGAASHTKLSIPPPHANEEARSQNHRLLFGPQATPDTGKPPTGQLAERLAGAAAPSPPASAKSLPTGQRKMLPTSTLAAQNGSQLHRPLQQSQQLARSNLSIHNKPPPPPPPPSLPEHDDTSGFSSYQSRRSLAPPQTRANQNQKANQNSASEQPNMIIMQTSQLPMLTPGSVNFNSPNQHLQFVSPNSNNNNNNNNNFYQHNFNNNTHHQLSIQASNQVPIMQPTSHPHHIGGFYNQNGRPVSSDFYNLYAQQKALHQQVSFPAGLFMNGSQHQQALFPAGEHQIYANAPPKPRRYQYYEAPAGQQHQMVLQQNAFLQQYRQQSYSFAPTGCQSSNIKPQIYNNLGYLQHSPVLSQLQHQQQLQQQQQQQQHHHHHYPGNGSAFGQVQQPAQQQQRSAQPSYFAGPPPVLTKSKSSLDIRDLAGYRQQQQQLRQNQLTQQHLEHLGTLRQAQIQHPNPLGRAPIYGSQVISQTDQRAVLPGAQGWYGPAGSGQFTCFERPQVFQQQQQQQQQQQRPSAFVKAPDLTSVISVNENSNSQLIVDLTTPRVLAKTQTTLMSRAGGSASNWSINQSGLPQVGACRPEQPPADQQISSPTEALQKNDLERSAPYYYSDLKSNEQQLALLNIAQQKSLSPPPQLLSRSIDLSNTRLTARSATMHASQARDLSDSLAAKQLHFNLMQLHQQHQEDQQRANQQQAHRVNNNTGILKPAGKLQSSPSGSSGSNSNSNTNSNSSSNQSSSGENQEIERLTGKADQLSLASAGTGSGSNKTADKKDSLVNSERQQLDNVSSRDSRLSLESGSGSGNGNGLESARGNLPESAGSSQFEAVGLGNVIDVDVCSLNNMSQFSPFNSHHLLQHHQSLTILN